MNKKIRNASLQVYDGIQFKSHLEVMTFKTLKEHNLFPEYEKKTFLLWEGFVPNTPFYTKNKFKRKNKNVKVLDNSTAIDNRPIQGITYTPDFVFEYNGRTIIVECKGIANDIFPYKFKMFRKHIDNLKENYEIWEIFTKKQLLTCIEHLKKSPTT